MSDQHHIDDIFRTGLGPYEHQPPAEVWEGIENRLHGRRTVAVWWYRAASVAAVLVVVFSGIWFFTLKQPSLPADDYLSALEREEEKTQQPAPALTGEPVAGVADAPVGTEPQMLPAEEAHTASYVVQTIPETIPPAADEPVITALSPAKALLLAPKLPVPAYEREDLHQLKTDFPPYFADLEPLQLHRPGKVRKWSIEGQFAPAVYSYRHLAATEGNIDLKNYYDQIEEGVFNMAGGINFNYHATGRLVVSSGIHYNQMGQNIKRVGEFILSSMGWETSEIHRKIAEKYYLVDHSTGTIVSSNENLKIVHQPEEAFQSTSLGRNPYEYRQETLETVDAQVLQNYRFLEVPLMMKYKVVDKDIGVSLLGGVSSNFLIGNSATLFLDGIVYSTIVTSDINRMNYSGTLGLGMDYELFPGFLFNVEPVFKYYLSPFSEKNLIGSHPYSLGIFSGVRYVF